LWDQPRFIIFGIKRSLIDNLKYRISGYYCYEVGSLRIISGKNEQYVGKIVSHELLAGKTCLKKNIFRPVKLKLKINTYRNISIADDSFGNVWVGTWGSGLFRIDSNNYVFNYTPNSENPLNHFTRNLFNFFIVTNFPTIYPILKHYGNNTHF